MKEKLVLVLMVAFVAGFATNASGQGFYEFSSYSGAGSEFDVACYGDVIYYGSGADVWSIGVSIGTAAMVDEPTHLVGADGIYGTGDDVVNPNYQARVFSGVGHVTLHSSVLNGGSIGEMYVDDTSIYTTGGSYGNEVFEFDKTTGAYVGLAVHSTTGPRASHLGFDAATGTWYMGNENRQVWSSTGGNWTYEFTYANMAGSHGDGMEFVNGNVWVSDMTSNFLARWGEGDNPETAVVETGWNEWNRFSYTEEFGGSSKVVEGMGFGALGHFWAGAGNSVYEIGGGEIGDYTVIPVPGAFLIGSIGLAVSSWRLRRRKEL